LSISPAPARWRAAAALAVVVGALCAGTLWAAPPARGATSITPTLEWSRTLPDAGAPVAQSSPIVAQLADGPAVVVGDRSGTVYALDLATGTAAPGWPVSTGGVPVDATPSVAQLGGGGTDTVFVGSGTAAVPDEGGYQAYNTTGTQTWFTQVINPPSDSEPDQGVAASLTVAPLQGTTAVVAGSLGQEEYALAAASGAPLAGWPFFTSDSVFATAAVGDLYGTGQDDIVDGGDQTTGAGRGQQYVNGGHVRILSPTGNLICHDDPDQTVDSSPAIGGFLTGGQPGIAVGTGGYFAGTSTTDELMALDDRCHVAWADRLDGATGSSPALADVLGNGQLDVVEGTDNGSAGSVWAVAGATGQVLWHQAVGGRVIGSVVTADLSGGGHQDVVVTSTAGASILDGVDGQVVGQLAPADPGCPVGFQNSALVTEDPDGAVGITVAGYNCNNQGVVEHYEVSGAGPVDEAGSWPMFHHDPQLTGNAGSLPPVGSVPACSVPAAAIGGYDLVGADGGLYDFGQPFCGSAGSLPLSRPVVGMAEDPTTGGYWLAASDGGVFAYGGAPFEGSMGGRPLVSPIVGMASTPDGGGYWLVAADGGVFAFGDAGYFGSMGGRPLSAPVVGMAADPDGMGYRLVAADGGVFAFGDAQYFGSMGGRHLNSAVVAIFDDVDTGGYWLVGADGGLFAFGAPFDGSMGGQRLVAPVVGAQPGPDGDGYWLVASDGGVFAFGDAQYFGSMGGRHLNAPVVGMGSG
jgi:hypothetical protein